MPAADLRSDPVVPEVLPLPTTLYAPPRHATVVSSSNENKFIIILVGSQLFFRKIHLRTDLAHSLSRGLPGNDSGFYSPSRPDGLGAVVLGGRCRDGIQRHSFGK